MTKRKSQLALDLPPQFGWGGKREGCGRKAADDEAGQRHRSREPFDARTPVHVTLRARPHVWNLRSRRGYAVVARALRGLLAREDFRVVHFTLLGNHVHLVTEADDALALGRAMRSLSIRLSLGLNALMGTRGPVLEDRYDAHVLRTLTEVRNAVAYVVGNFASHATRLGEPLPPSFVDPFSSAAAIGPDGLPPPVQPPRTWLLGQAGRELGMRRGATAGEEVAAYIAA